VKEAGGGVEVVAPAGGAISAGELIGIAPVGGGREAAAGAGSGPLISLMSVLLPTAGEATSVIVWKVAEVAGLSFSSFSSFFSSFSSSSLVTLLSTGWRTCL